MATWPIHACYLSAESAALRHCWSQWEKAMEQIERDTQKMPRIHVLGCHFAATEGGVTTSPSIILLDSKFSCYTLCLVNSCRVDTKPWMILSQRRVWRLSLAHSNPTLYLKYFFNFFCRMYRNAKHDRPVTFDRWLRLLPLMATAVVVFSCWIRSVIPLFWSNEQVHK
jgi:hypothetical protein